MAILVEEVGNNFVQGWMEGGQFAREGGQRELLHLEEGGRGLFAKGGGRRWKVLLVEGGQSQKRGM